MCGVAFTDRLLKGELMWGNNLKRSQESGLCTATGQMWSESLWSKFTSREASWIGKTLGCGLRQ